MIAIKRRCKFFNRCQFADETSRTCTVDAGGDYCGAYRAQLEPQKEKEGGEEMIINKKTTERWIRSAKLVAKGFLDGVEKHPKKVLLISNYDEWWGPIYICPFCAEETLWDDFNFCPNCGGNLEGFRFETTEEDEKRMKKGNE